MNLIFRAEFFEAYGLNKYRNFMEEFECELDSNTDVFNFVNESLKMHGCEAAAIFLIDYHGGMWAGIKMDGYYEEDEMELLGRKDFDVNWFAELDGDYRFCCYGLMIETRPGRWKIINEV